MARKVIIVLNHKTTLPSSSGSDREKYIYSNRSSVCLPYVTKFAKGLTLIIPWCCLKLYIYLSIHIHRIFIYKVESITSQNNTLTVKAEHTKI